MGNNCGFQCNRLIIDQIVFIDQMLGMNSKYSRTVHQQFIDLNKSYDFLNSQRVKCPEMYLFCMGAELDLSC